DKDLATHLARTHLIRLGKRLSEITDSARKRHSIKAKIIPATDDEVTTILNTDKGEMHLQEFWVKHGGTLKVRGIKFQGSNGAVANPDAIDAIRRSRAVIVAPANPVSSIGPTVALKSIRDALKKKRDKVFAVSPLIGSDAISGPAVKYMKAIGLENSPIGVAEYYRDFVGTFVISEHDHSMAKKILDMGMRVRETEITMKNRRDEIRLARYLVDGFGTR
ncbi:MAG: 2-phospho-L-lactate transferase CofD family protein, partial [Nitrososphaera sp.]|nr:2-phospho-L-lactate transferase CofD family protein [Nitrososphaera sp.]